MKERCFEDAKEDFLAVQEEAGWLLANIGPRNMVRQERLVAGKSQTAAKSVEGERLAPQQFREGAEDWRKASESYDNG